MQQTKRLTKRERRILRQQGVLDENNNVSFKLNFRLKDISPLTANQRKTFSEFEKGKNMLLHGIAGTGKSFISLYLSLRELISGDSQYEKIYIVRSAVPTRDMGFLPGNNKEKSKIGNNKTIKAKSDFHNIIIDDLYVPFLNPANYFDVCKDLKTLNFKIIKQNKIKHRVNHDILYPDFPAKKNHIVFDVKKIKAHKNKKLFYTMDQEKEGKITKDNHIINENNKLFDHLFKINKKFKLYEKNLFIHNLINLYKKFYLISVTNISSKLKHKFVKENLEKIIIKFNS